MEISSEQKANQTKKKKRGLIYDSNKLLSMAAIFISAVTLFILIYQTSLATRQFELEQKQQIASSMPYLVIYNSNEGTKRFSIEIRNFGLGPAFVQQVNVLYEDSLYQNYDLPSLYHRVLKPNGYRNTLLYTGGLRDGDVIPANENFTHIMFSTDSSATALSQDALYTGKISLEITYASIYGETWVVRGMSAKPEKIEESSVN